MKKLKLIMAVVAAFVCLNLLYGTNPKNKDFTINLADNMVKSLCRDIVLTDSQKIIIQTSAKEYEGKMKNLKSNANSESKKLNNKQAILNYRAKLNSILTPEQIDTLKMKRIERSMTLNSNGNTK